MSSIAIITGVILILIGIAGYLFSIINSNHSVTALIPAGFGILIALFGFLAQKKENLRKHLMHAAVLVALVGFIVPTGRLASQLGKIEVSLAVMSQFLMALVCLFFVILAVQSFIKARRTTIAE